MAGDTKDKAEGQNAEPEDVELDTIPDPRAGVITEEGEGPEEAAPGEAAEEPQEAAAISRPLGIDVSNHQGIVNWAKVSGAGMSFAFAKASEGTGFRDPFFARNWQGMKSAGLLRGAYHFFRPQLSAAAQANLFIQMVGRLEPGDLPPVIDVEVADGASAAAIVQGIQQWVQRVQDALGRDPMIYTGPSFWRSNAGNSSAFSQTLPLWIAHYTTGRPTIPDNWPFQTFHQFTDSGRVNGVSGNVDMNRFNGDMAGLRRLAGIP